MSVKLCKDCKHFVAENWTCARDGSLHLVDGHKIKVSCEMERYGGACGTEGRFFEEKGGK